MIIRCSVCNRLVGCSHSRHSSGIVKGLCTVHRLARIRRLQYLASKYPQIIPILRSVGKLKLLAHVAKR